MLTCSNEVLPSPTLLAQLDARLHLGKLKLYERIFRVTIGMILGEDFECFFVSASGYKPARGFRKEKDEEDLNKGRRCLE
jgi:hypothetical protein